MERKKLTKEEKLQKKLEKEELKQLKMVEDEKQLFRDHLNRELNYSKTTYNRAAKEWQKMCEDIKFISLRGEMEYLWQYVNSLLDRKELKIKFLLDNLDICEEQYQRNYSKHLDLIDYFIRIYKRSLKLTKTSYDTYAQNMINQLEQTAIEPAELNADRKKYFENRLLAKNTLTANKLNQNEKDFNIFQDDNFYSHVEKRYMYNEQCIHKMEKIYQQMQIFVKQVQDDALIPKRTKLYNKYVQKESSIHAELKVIEERTRTTQGILTNLKNVSNLHDELTKRNIGILKEEKKELLKNYWLLKQSDMQNENKNDVILQFIAGEGYKTIRHLEKWKKYGEIMLGFATACRKLQTENEKVVLCPEEQDLTAFNNSRHITESDEAIEQTKQMRYFAYRQSKAEIHVSALLEEKLKLKKENDYLREAIKCYCDMRSYNAVISSLRISPNETVTIPVQEASQMIQFRKKK